MQHELYKLIQDKLSKKLITNPTNKEDEYNKGILAAKSIIKDIYCKRGEQNNKVL